MAQIGHEHTDALEALAQAARSAVRVLVVDEFPIARSGITSMLDGYPGLDVVGEADDAASAEDAARRLRPDLVVIDPVMARGDGFEALRTMRAEHQEARILVLAKTDDLEVASEAMRCGADGFLVKTVTQSALLNAIQRLLNGEPVVDPQVAARAVRAGGPPSPVESMPDPLTPRELEVLRLLSLGHTNPQIARQLYMAVGTVKVHVEHLLGKLGATDRTDAAVRAAGMGLLTPDQEEGPSAERHMPAGT
jgi:DNA-binding NarL/FixJ family response regulator